MYINAKARKLKRRGGEQRKKKRAQMEGVLIRNPRASRFTKRENSVIAVLCNIYTCARTHEHVPRGKRNTSESSSYIHVYCKYIYI